jgi:hypothetical protein
MHDLRTDPLDAPPYVVTCLETDPAAGAGHEHVVAIETRDPDGGQTRWATVEVISAIREGERFVVGDGNGDTAASLEPAVCAACSRMTLSVGPGGSEIAPCG